MQAVTETQEPDSKTDRHGFYKTANGALINKDNTALAAYKKRKNRERAIDTMQEQIDTIKGDLAEIKALLQGLAK